MTATPSPDSLAFRQHQAAGLLLFLSAGALAGLGLWTGLSQDWQIILWLVWVAVGCAWLSGFGRRLWSPVLGFELARLGRRPFSFFLRSAFGLILLLALGSLYLLTVREADTTARLKSSRPARAKVKPEIAHQPTGQRLSSAELVALTELFSVTVIGTEFLLVVLLTPVLVAGSLVAEKEQRTLDCLLTTDLDHSEIVLSKLLARLIVLAVMGLVGLPLLALAQFLGGLDFRLVLAGFAVVFLTLLGLAGLGVLISSLASQTRTAIATTYMTIAVYLGLGYGLDLYLPRFPEVGRLGGWLTLQQVVDALNQGNPAVLARSSFLAWEQGQLFDFLPWYLMGYAIFHFTLCFASVAFATLRLDGERQPPAPPRDSGHALPVDADPLWWREVRRNTGLGLGRLGGLTFLMLVLVSYLPFLWVAAEAVPALVEADPSWGELYGAIRHFLGVPLRPWVMLVGTLASCLTFVAVAVRAAAGIAGERDHQTLDSLLTTPYRREGILFAKWFASIWSVRWTWPWLASIWLIGVLTGALHVLSVPLLATAWLVLAALSATVGLACSVHSATTLKASLATLVCLMLLWFGHWLLLGCFLPFFYYGAVQMKDLPEWLSLFQLYGLTPPFTLQALAFGPEVAEASWAAHRIVGKGIALVGSALCGLALWTVSSLVIWYWTLARFRSLAGEHALEPLAYFAASVPVEELFDFQEVGEAPRE